MEFLDLESEENHLHHWARGGCLFGIVPCNGLLYLTPHPCDCYIATKLNGFFALAPARNGEGGRRKAEGARNRGETQEEPLEGRLQRGPAYGRISPPPSPLSLPPSDDWPTYRHDPRRSGSTKSAVPTCLQRLWQVELGRRPSPAVVAGGKVFTTKVDQHEVVALDAVGGEQVWSFTAGGPVDTPPTVHQGLALFGSADGWVYCLRASDGQLVWRRRAAPQERLVGAFGGLESAWPVHGSILVKDGVAYLAAGRSSYLDGGIYVYALDPRTGKVLEEQVIYSPDPQTGRMPPGDARSLPGVLADVLVSDGASVYMRQMKVFDGREKAGRHVFSTAGFLDDSWFNRTHWAVGAVSRAQLLVFDDASAYGVQAYPSISRGNFFHPGEQGYLLFASELKRAADRGPSGGRNTPKGRRPLKTRWSLRVPVRATAMVLADGTLLVAGFPDAVDPADPLAAFEGRKGGRLWAFSASDGKQVAQRPLEAPPVWDGMAAAGGRVYLSTSDGKILCLGGR